MKIVFFSLILFMGIGCKRTHTDSEVRKELSAAMKNFLYSTHKKDSSEIKYEILSVIYFEDKTFYECEYKVRMHIVASGYDTVGTMTARVSKDFSQVKRKL